MAGSRRSPHTLTALAICHAAPGNGDCSPGSDPVKCHSPERFHTVWFVFDTLADAVCLNRQPAVALDGYAAYPFRRTGWRAASWLKLARMRYSDRLDIGQGVSFHDPRLQ